MFSRTNSELKLQAAPHTKGCPIAEFVGESVLWCWFALRPSLLRAGLAGHRVAVDEEGEDAVSHAAVADEEHGRQEDQAADGARLPLQKKAHQVEDHEHHVILYQRQVHGLGDQQHGDEPLQAVHGRCWARRLRPDFETRSRMGVSQGRRDVANRPNVAATGANENSNGGTGVAVDVAVQTGRRTRRPRSPKTKKRFKSFPFVEVFKLRLYIFF